MSMNTSWSVWDETEADSDPSDPGVTYCKEWFIGRWAPGEAEPSERILIGANPGAEVAARRIAKALNRAFAAKGHCNA